MCVCVCVCRGFEILSIAAVEIGAVHSSMNYHVVVVIVVHICICVRMLTCVCVCRKIGVSVVVFVLQNIVSFIGLFCKRDL